MSSIEEDFEDGQWPFGGEDVAEEEPSEADEVPTPSGASCVKINEILGMADTEAGEYSFGGIAKTLPFAPGLVVDGVGRISFPLIPEQAEKLIEKCEKSPFGHNLETKMDENVRKSWQLAPDQVEISNTQWRSGIEELTKTIAQRLGYEKVPMLCVLYKVLVYGEGGHFLKHQDTEKEDGMIATLVIQPPSEHEGGDLVVFRGGKERYRHDFGKSGGTAAFSTHFAVHYADAEHALEKVTKGYRLVLVYSLCLPPTMRHLERDSGLPTCDDLGDAISEMVSEEESLALLLSHEYTKKSIGKLGTSALKGVDSARFRALEEANAQVPTDKKLRFFIAEISLKIVSCPGSGFNSGWQEDHRSEKIDWYASTGEYLGYCKEEKFQTKLNFLNPGQETYAQIWEQHGDSIEKPYTGNEGPTQKTKYCTYAIVAWPAVQHAGNALKMMSVELAVEALFEQRPIEVTALREFLDKASKKLGPWRAFCGKTDEASARFCRPFCELLVETGDVDLAKDFLSKNFPRLGLLSENTTLLPVITKMIDQFDWGVIGKDVMDKLSRDGWYDEEKTPGDSSLEMTVQVLESVQGESARKDLLKLAVEEALKVDKKRDDDEDLNSSKVAGMLWKHIVQSTDQTTFDTITTYYKKKNPQQLGPAVEMFSQYVGDLEELSVKRMALTSIAVRRVKWLKEKTTKMDTAFSWKMPGAEFPDNKEIEDFLRGPDTSMKTQGLITFSGIPAARKFAAKYPRTEQHGASFKMMPAGKGKNAYLTITKTRMWFDARQAKLVKYKEELETLQKIYDGSTATSRKKPRRE
ncbi:hypothetical protein P3T76_012004 [Phytophthora citrophthora]|uniref:Fe2OG dioxygenase domain-containing protein n=1 Tax=Phytophthora citrophthora TaxID=4793 RepID=A0AAD9LDH2_9STRA|nr:hypothetical protein P3T76_012004 [Phytophthora citrophthora]